MADLSIFDLTGKKALVTGGSTGIGRACAIGMAKAGADVAIIDIKDETGQETVKSIKAVGRKSIYVRCDVTDPKQVASMVKQVVKEFGRLDIAFNNAGIGGLGNASIDDDAIEVWHKIMNINLNAVFYCCREEAKVMIPQKYGKIINTASMSATIINNFPTTTVGLVTYCTAKAGVKHLTKALAMEWVQHNIFVNSISPGYITTPLTQFVRDNPPLLAHENLTTPMHRQAEAEELVGGVIYLASDSSSFTTGCDLIMDGGHTVW
jgi:NAD(P)-dependent dehydrogenase (short-subunit alcohol dehydrogenase family)